MFIKIIQEFKKFALEEIYLFCMKEEKMNINNIYKIRLYTPSGIDDIIQNLIMNDDNFKLFYLNDLSEQEKIKTILNYLIMDIFIYTLVYL